MSFQLIELRDETNPFFIYLSHRAVHHPTQCDTELINRFGGVWNATRRNYLAQVASVDDSVGELVQLLEGEGKKVKKKLTVLMRINIHNFIHSRTAIAGAIIGLLLVFLRLEEEYCFFFGFFFTGSTIRSDAVLS